MRVLIPAGRFFLDDKNANPFIRCLYEGLRRCHFDVVCDVGEFWNHGEDYDLIFFQWPEVVFENEEIDNVKLENQVRRLKAKGCKMMITCHNLHPHNNNPEADKTYGILYAAADSIHHMGEYSYRLLKDIYPQSRHFIAPHPIFYDILATGLKQEDCRRQLGLPLRKKIILAFGVFRNEEEKQVFFSLRNRFSPHEVALVAPRLDHGYGLYHGWRLHLSLRNLYKRVKMRLRQIYCYRKVVDEEDIPAYFIAADIILIQRLEILNSGNVPLAFSAGKVVVGPDKGNVGVLLKETGNPCFDTANPADFFDKCEVALRLAQNQEAGRRNYDYACRNMLPDKVVNTIAEEMNFLLSS